jgi:hypothetical protein
MSSWRQPMQAMRMVKSMAPPVAPASHDRPCSAQVPTAELAVPCCHFVEAQTAAQIAAGSYRVERSSPISEQRGRFEAASGSETSARR